MSCACTANEALKKFWAEEVMPTRQTLGGEHTRTFAGHVLWEVRMADALTQQVSNYRPYSFDIACLDLG